MLIEAKASLNKPDFHGKTPLVISMEKGFDAITALLRNAAEPPETARAFTRQPFNVRFRRFGGHELEFGNLWTHIVVTS